MKKLLLISLISTNVFAQSFRPFVPSPIYTPPPVYTPPPAPAPIHCTTYTIGSTTYTSCY